MSPRWTQNASFSGVQHVEGIEVPTSLQSVGRFDSWIKTHHGHSHPEESHTGGKPKEDGGLPDSGGGARRPC
jgi:hypothetical protein